MASAAIIIDGAEVPLRLRRHPRARHFRLTVEPASDSPVLTLPRGATLEQGLDFARSRSKWLGRRMAALPPRVPFAAGAVLPVLGELRTVLSQASGRRGVRLGEQDLRVTGPSERLAVQVRGWLRELARAEYTRRVGAMSATLGARPGRLTVRDPRTRWGSCSAAGNLSFSWRLVMAPPRVMDYVTAHEVAHLKELNHGRRFWSLVAALVDDVTEPKAWLRTHGPALHRYG